MVATDDSVTFENSISLKKFPPTLRKLGKYLLQLDESITLKEACQRVKVDYGTAKSLISRHKQRGNDFHEFIEVTADTYLKENLLAVDHSTVQGAVSGGHQDRKLYYQRIGKLTETTNINVGTLAIGINITGVNPQDNERAAGVIDVEPVIPKGK